MIGLISLTDKILKKAGRDLWVEDNAKGGALMC